MLKIRSDQMASMGQYMLEEFQRRMTVLLRSRPNPHQQDETEAGLREFIEAGISEAASHEIEVEMDVQRFLECRRVFGRDFPSREQHSWVIPLLQNQDLSAAEKKARFDGRANFAGYSK